VAAFWFSEDRFWPEGDFWAVCLWADETRFLDAGAVIAVSSWLLLGPSGLSEEWQFGHSLAEILPLNFSSPVTASNLLACDAPHAAAAYVAQSGLDMFVTRFSGFGSVAEAASANQASYSTCTTGAWRGRLESPN
jgi:hypothetical protein